MTRDMKTIILIILFIAAGFVISELFRSWLLFQKSRALVSNSVPFQRTNPDAQLRILILGDSTAVGTGSVNPPDSVAGRFGHDYQDAEIINLGANGKRTKDVAKEFRMENYVNFDLIVIQVGGNDILRFTPLSDLRKDLQELLRKAKQSAPHVVVLHSGNIGLAPFFPRFLGPLYTYRTKQVRSVFMEAAEESGAMYVDLFTDRKNDPFLKDVKRFYAPDFLHASGEGYGIWYQRIRETMKNAGIAL
jgi:lysophospholipase L1-like esterase